MKKTKKQTKEVKAVENPQEVPPPLTKQQRIKKIIILSAALIGFNLFVWGSLYYATLDNGSGEASQATGSEKTSNSFTDFFKVKTDPTPTPTPEISIPFEEMTIPYLRDREYKSELSDLNFISENESYTSYFTSYDSDGLKINGQLTVPAGEAPDGGHPAIVFIHGYIPPQNYGTLSNYADYVDFLARSGYVVFKIDLRGHAESEGVPTGAYFSGDYIIDTLNAKAALKETDFVNEDKIGLWGHSMGGNVVSRSMAADPSIPAIVIWAGAVYTYEDFYDFQIQDSSYQPPAEESERRKKRSELFGVHGVFDPESDFWSKVPMTNYLDDLSGAISIHHAIDDNVVNIGYSRGIIEKLKQAGVENELIEYSSGGHNINGVSFTPAMQNTVIFFDEHLK